MIDKTDPVLYTVNDIMRIFRMGKSRAYQLMVSDGFPSFRLNKKIYVSQEKLEKWIEKTCGKTYKY